MAAPQFDFEKYFDVSLDLLCIAGTDGYFKRVNASFERVLGWPEDELLKRPFLDFVHPADRKATQAEVDKLAGGIPTISFKNRFKSLDGNYRHLQWTAYPDVATGLLFAIARDVTDLHEADDRFRLAMDASPTAMIMSDKAGTIQIANREAESLFGYPPGKLKGESIEKLVPPRFQHAHQDHVVRFFMGPATRPMGAARDLLGRRRDGSEFPAEIGLKPLQIRGETFVLSAIVNLTARKQAEDRMLKLARDLEEANVSLTKQASTDMLTALRNRRAFEEQLSLLVRLTHRGGRTLSLLMIDVDRFKGYNDEYGHVAGDDVLRTVAALLYENARASDVPARYGGEEFSVILPDSDREGSLVFAERLRASVQNYSWQTSPITVSVGAATISFENGKPLEELKPGSNLILQADQALYHSKRSGRNMVFHYAALPEHEMTD